MSMIHTLSNHVKQRKSKLNTYLTNNNDDLHPERQHQIYGALNEMDNILEVLENHKKEETHLENNPEEVFLFKPIKKKANVVEFIKNIF